MRANARTPRAMPTFAAVDRPSLPTFEKGSPEANVGVGADVPVIISAKVVMVATISVCTELGTIVGAGRDVMIVVWGFSTMMILSC